MPVSLFSQLCASGGLRHKVELGLSGRPEELLRVREVRYDLGPTFVAEDRHRIRQRSEGGANEPDPASPFTIEVEAYGNFDVSADVIVGDGRVEHLSCTIVTALDPVTVEDVMRSFEQRVLTRPRPRAPRRRLASFSVWGQSPSLESRWCSVSATASGPAYASTRRRGWRLPHGSPFCRSARAGSARRCRPFSR